MIVTGFCLSFFWATLTSATETASAAREEPDWESLAKLDDVSWPKPLATLEWRTDFVLARKEARESGRPLFVTLRCLPCKQCAEFDKDVLEAGSGLSSLLRQFITVRLLSMRDLDHNLFPYSTHQDLDLSWWGYFHDGHAPIAVYGGRDEVSDTTRISVPSLRRTMERVLNAWYSPQSLHSRSEAQDRAPSTIVEHPGWESWAARGAEEAKPNECLHCHQTAEVLRQPAIDGGAFDKRTGFWVWPFPENTGMVLDRDDGLLVREVLTKSPAERMGLREGDSLLGARKANGEWTVLYGQADFRGVLHRAAEGEESATVELVWSRKGAVERGSLALAKGWRQTDLGWRKSVAEAAIGANTGFPWPLAVNKRDRQRLGIAADSLAIRPYYPKGAKGIAGDAGLRGHHIITEVNGESPNVAGRAFLVWFRQRFEPGDEIELTVREKNGRKKTITYLAPYPHRH